MSPRGQWVENVSQDGSNPADYDFKSIFLIENIWISTGGVMDSWALFHMIRTHVRGFFDTDFHEVSWHFATHEAIRPSGF